MASIQERVTATGDKHFRVQVRLKGRPVQRATFRRLTDARRWAQETETDLRRDRFFPNQESKQRTLSELIEQYLRSELKRLAPSGRDMRRQQLEWWSGRLGRYTLADLRPGLIAEGRDALARRSGGGGLAGPATQNRYLAALSAVLTYGVGELEWLPTNPCRNVRRAKEPQGRVRFLDDGERRRLLDACRRSKNQDLYLLVLLAITTGMRRAELLALKWNDVDLDRGVAIVDQSKNGDRRSVPVVGPALDLLRESDGKSPSGFVFGRANGPIQWPRKAWMTALGRAGIEDFRFHDCRHTAASYLAQSGARLHEIAEILGHRTLQMVKRYAHLTDQQTTAAARRMADKFLVD